MGGVCVAWYLHVLGVCEQACAQACGSFSLRWRCSPAPRIRAGRAEQEQGRPDSERAAGLEKYWAVPGGRWVLLATPGASQVGLGDLSPPSRDSDRAASRGEGLGCRSRCRSPLPGPRAKAGHGAGTARPLTPRHVHPGRTCAQGSGRGCPGPPPLSPLPCLPRAAHVPPRPGVMQSSR